MAKTGTMLVKNLRYLCLVGVIALGLIAIVGSNGGGGGGGDGETDTTQSCQNYTAIVSPPSLWTQLSPTGTAPTARRAHVSVYDAANDSLILFGGRNSSQYFNDTWVLTNASGASGTPSWNQLTTPTIPVPSQRRLAIGAYNTEKNMLIIFGGTDQNNAIPMDLWVLSNANGLEGGIPTWSQLSISGSAPSVRVCMAGVYDESSDTLIFFGGLSCTTTACTPYDETYIIRNVTTAPTWQELYPSGTPPAARAYHSAVYDATNNRMILFGGTTSTANPPAASGRVRDTWVLSNANGTAGTPAWSQLTTAQQPPARSGHSAVFDETNNRMIIFAGAGTDNYVRNDVWILTNAGGTIPAWAEYDTGTPKPASRIHHSAVYTDTAKNRMIIFGGDTGNSTYVNDAWVLRNANGIPTTPVNSITIDSASTTVCTGYTIQLTAVAIDSSGNEISGVLYIWSSSDTAVATVSSNGLVTGVGPGTATITVSSGNISGQLTMTVIQSTSPPSDGGGLSPARELAGTWRTTFPVKFYIKTDFCSANPELVASEDRTVTMIITEETEYTVNIEMRHESSNFTVLDQQCNPTGYVPDVSPTFLYGTIASTQLTVTDSQDNVLGIFNFTTDLMEGTWNDFWCAVYCQIVYTETNQLKLTRQ